MVKSTVIVTRKDNTEHTIYMGSAEKVAGMQKSFVLNMPNVIRLWKLGSSDPKIPITQASVDKLLDILKNGLTDGAMDLAWADQIDLNIFDKSSFIDIGENIFIDLELIWMISFNIGNDE